MGIKKLQCVVALQYILGILCVSFVCITTATFPKPLRDQASTNYNNNSCLAREYNISQPVDHFDLLNDKYFNERYFVNDCYYKKGGPVFIMLGDESALDSYWLEQGTMMEFCKKLNCVAYTMEHRYFGTSFPVADTNMIVIESLKYFTIEQALADYARFIRVIVKSLYKYNKIINVGGSYGGALAVFFSTKYPSLVDITWSSSGGPGFQYNYIDYFETAGRVINNISPECYKEVQLGFSNLNAILQTPSQTCGSGHESCSSYVQKLFNLCGEMDVTNEEDMSNLFQVLAQLFVNVVQYNSGMGNYSMQNLCSSIFQNKSSGLSPVHKVAQFVEVFLTESSFAVDDFTCMNYTQKSFCYTMQDASRYDGVYNGLIMDRPWLWLTCTQLMSFQTSDGKHQPFGHRFPIELLVSQCQCAFDQRFNANFLKHKIADTWEKFGGFPIAQQTKRVIYVNGDSDPWNKVGILYEKQTTCFNKVILIPGASHCVDLGRSKLTDGPAIKIARHEIFTQIVEWLHTQDGCCPNTLESFYNSHHSTEY